MKLLDAVNTVLPYMGEHPVTDLDTAHPTVDLIIKAIDRQRQALLAEGWWFNERTLTLPVNTDGKIDAPTEIISIYGLDCDVDIRGDDLIDTYTGSWLFSAPIKVEAIDSVTVAREYAWDPEHMTEEERNNPLLAETLEKLSEDHDIIVEVIEE